MAFVPGQQRLNQRFVYSFALQRQKPDSRGNGLGPINASGQNGFDAPADPVLPLVKLNQVCPRPILRYVDIQCWPLLRSSANGELRRPLTNPSEHRRHFGDGYFSFHQKLKGGQHQLLGFKRITAISGGFSTTFFIKNRKLQVKYDAAFPPAIDAAATRVQPPVRV